MTKIISHYYDDRILFLHIITHSQAHKNNCSNIFTSSLSQLARK
jgi:hypothetical protein